MKNLQRGLPATPSQASGLRGGRGQSLVEIILVMALSAIILPALLTGIVSSRQGKVQQAQRTKAVYLLNETVDAIRSVRERGWAAFAVNGTYHATASGSIWTLAAGSATVNGFNQSITISDVNRGTCPGVDCGKIVASGGTLDPSSKKVDVTISWTAPYPSSITNTFYLTRYLDNDAFIETRGLITPPLEFDLGTKTSVDVVATLPPLMPYDAQVQLGVGGGGGDWCQPSKSILEVDLPKNGAANAISAIASESGSTVFAGTGDNSSGVSFAKVSIVGDPPSSAIIAATFDGYKTNAVFGEANYAYLGTDNNSKEIVIMSLTEFSDPPTNSKYKEVGYINVVGNGNGNGIYVLSNKAYVLANGKLYIYDITNRSGGHSTELNTGGLTLSGTGKKVLVVPSSDGKTYAYIATNSTSNQFQIVDVSNASSPTIVGQKTLGTSQAGVDVYVNTQNLDLNRAYFATSYSSGKPNFFILNISSKTNPTIVGGGYNTNGMSPKGLTVVTGNRAIIVGTGGTNQYQVINISDEANLTSCAGLQYNTGVNGVASILQDNGYAYSYIITGDSAAELKIILGGAGAGSAYASAGNFVSDTFDPGYLTAFNRFDVSVNRPVNTDIKFQVAIKQAVGSPLTCSSVPFSNGDFVGPDGTNGSKFETTQTTGTQIFNYVIPSSLNPGRCFRYKVYLSNSDSSATPIFHDITLNFSP